MKKIFIAGATLLGIGLVVGALMVYKHAQEMQEFNAAQETLNSEINNDEAMSTTSTIDEQDNSAEDVA